MDLAEQLQGEGQLDTMKKSTLDYLLPCVVLLILCFIGIGLACWLSAIPTNNNIPNFLGWYVPLSLAAFGKMIYDRWRSITEYQVYFTLVQRQLSIIKKKINLIIIKQFSAYVHPLTIHEPPAPVVVSRLPKNKQKQVIAILHHIALVGHDLPFLAERSQTLVDAYRGQTEPIKKLREDPMNTSLLELAESLSARCKEVCDDIKSYLS